MHKRKKAGPAWLVLVAYVVGYDYYAIKNGHETLSGGFWRHLERYPGRIVMTLIATLLYKHLVAPDFLPQTDPLRHLVNKWHRKANDTSREN